MQIGTKGLLLLTRQREVHLFYRTFSQLLLSTLSLTFQMSQSLHHHRTHLARHCLRKRRRMMLQRHRWPRRILSRRKSQSQSLKSRTTRTMGGAVTTMTAMLLLRLLKHEHHPLDCRSNRHQKLQGAVVVAFQGSWMLPTSKQDSNLLAAAVLMQITTMLATAPQQQNHARHTSLI